MLPARAPALILGLALDLALLPRMARAAPTPEASASSAAQEVDPRAPAPAEAPTAAEDGPGPATAEPSGEGSSSEAGTTDQAPAEPAAVDAAVAPTPPVTPEGPPTDVGRTPDAPDRGDWSGRTLTRAGIGMTVLGAALGATAIGLAAASAGLDDKLGNDAHDGRLVTDKGTFYAPEEAARREQIIEDGKTLNKATMIVAIPAVVVLTTGIAMLATARPWKRAENRRLRLRAGVGPRSGALALEGRF